MCGLLGFIGESSDAELSQRLTTSLFIKTESRGVDASGFYCVSDFKNNDILFHKRPIKSSIYTLQDEFASIWKYKLNLGIFHCRAASIGVGAPIINENNHPFVSSDLSKAVMHNGLIDKNDYDLLKTYYEVETTCDSEIILRILEQNDDIYNKLSLFYENTNSSAYAIAFTEIDEYERNLYLFRNELRPLYVIDLTKELNQIFFFSTPEIFLSAVSEINLKLENLRIHEIQPYNLLSLKYDTSSCIQLKQFHVQVDDTKTKTDLSYAKINKSKSDFKNKILTKEAHSIDIILGMIAKMDDNLSKLKAFVNDPDQANMQNEKIQLLFQYFKESNKKLENINKILLSKI